jgi:hypothetical protein
MTYGFTRKVQQQPQGLRQYFTLPTGEKYLARMAEV